MPESDQVAGDQNFNMYPHSFLQPLQTLSLLKANLRPSAKHPLLPLGSSNRAEHITVVGLACESLKARRAPGKLLNVDDDARSSGWLIPLTPSSLDGMKVAHLGAVSHAALLLDPNVAVCYNVAASHPFRLARNKRVFFVHVMLLKPRTK